MKKGRYRLTYACFSFNFFIWIMIDSNAVSNEASKDFEFALQKFHVWELLP
jgi:hypothetical protein